MSEPANDAHTPEWLPPSAALTRFKQGDTVLALGGAQIVEHVRYAVHVGGIGILIPESTVSEVLDRSEIFSLPNTASWVEGLINLRGNVVPVFSLHALFGTDPVVGARQMLLIIDKGENALGIAIDGLPALAPDSVEMDQRPPLPEVLNKFTDSAFEHGGQVWLEVDIRGLIKSLSREMAA
ncbi:MAG: chemotaxis protein CheW [Gammaproteobacteria bacterium]|nr:chemotaxis protein CheW [Gammaproteobacteria bacterium]